MATFDWVELTWVLLSLLALVFSTILLGEAYSDVKLMASLKHKGRRWLVAVANTRREATRCVQQGLFLTVGVISVFTPPPAHTQPNRVWMIVMLLTAQGLLLYNSIADYRERWLLRQWSGVEGEEA